MIIHVFLFIDMKNQEQAPFNSGASELDTSVIHTQPNTAIAPKHIYIQQQNSKGRFIPNLLLLNKLHYTVDSSNNTLLGHMCSYNSPLLPLYIKQLPDNDELFNKKNSFGYSPLDIAGMYCNKNIIDLLKSKGAVDNGGVDYWAIRGANMQNWSGNVPLDRKQLIHWAVYNDLPEVLEQYHKNKANLVEPDINGATPIQIACSNLSYRSFDYLLSVGVPIEEEKVIRTKSKSLISIYNKYHKSKRYISPLLAFLIYSIFEYVLSPELSFAVILFLVYITFLVVYFEQQPPIMTNHTKRIFHFTSSIFQKRIQWGNNHHFYLLFNSGCCLTGFISILYSKIESYWTAFLFITIALSTLVFTVNLILELLSVSANLTHSELFESSKSPHLFKKVQVVQEFRLVYHVFNNPYNQGIRKNWKFYLSLI